MARGWQNGLQAENDSMSFYTRWAIVFLRVGGGVACDRADSGRGQTDSDQFLRGRSDRQCRGERDCWRWRESIGTIEPLRPIDRGDNAWMLTSSVLVLFMTAPGLALFYGGMVRKKNVLGVMMQCVFSDGADEPDLGGVRIFVRLRRGIRQRRALEWSHWIGNADHLFLAGIGASGAMAKP